MTTLTIHADNSHDPAGLKCSLCFHDYSGLKELVLQVDYWRHNSCVNDSSFAVQERNFASTYFNGSDDSKPSIAAT